MASEWYEVLCARVRALPCPLCGAGSGALCLTVRRRLPIFYLHRARLRAWNRSKESHGQAAD